MPKPSGNDALPPWHVPVGQSGGIASMRQIFTHWLENLEQSSPSAHRLVSSQSSPTLPAPGSRHVVSPSLPTTAQTLPKGQGLG